jgi:polar amino acid transport system substrate-binding protein
MQCRVNAGKIDAASWVHDPGEGGGRIIGEVCHFADLLQYFCDAAPVRVYASSVGGDSDAARLQDNVTLQIAFADGSIGNILYTSQGARSLPKERVEIFAGGTTLVIDNFKQTLVYGAGVSKQGGMNQDKGQDEMLKAFLEAAQKGTPAPIPWEQIMFTSLVTFDALESLRLGQPVDIESL